MKPLTRRAYMSDLTDAKWLRLEAILKKQNALGRPRVIDLREVVNALCYRWHTKCSWRMLPHDFPTWQTVYAYYYLWQTTGLLNAIKEVVMPERTEAVCVEDFPATLPFERPSERPTENETSNGQHNLTA
ncbi:transposase [Lacunimicrobium album]